MPKRSGKFYSKNEKEVMKLLGLKPVPMSGAGWIEKEDGENDEVLCQLKSTDAESYRIQKLDLEKLEYHAKVSHKLPVFVIQFLKDDSLYALLRIEDLDYFTEISPKEQKQYVDEDMSVQSKIKVKSSSSKSRKEFYERRELQWKKQKR